MAVVPGSGAIITPVFNDQYGIDSVIIEDTGSGYDPEQPPYLRIGNCGIPVRDAVLNPVIIDGKIVSVKVLDSGEGYDPLRIKFTPIVPEGEEVPDPADAKVFLTSSGSVEYVQVTQPGDKHFYDVEAEILGGGGIGAVLKAVPKTITGIALLNAGRNYETEPFLSVDGGGGAGASGIANVDRKGVLSTNVSITNPGQFYQSPPFVLFIGGGGIGAKGKAVINQGSVVSIIVTEQGKGYTSPPDVVFARQATLKRKARNRQSYNSALFDITGLTRDIGRSDSSIYVGSTTKYPNTGYFLLEKEIIRYIGKDANRFTGCSRGLNFRYDQRVILDTSQNDPDTGLSAFEFNIGDRITRVESNSSSKIAIVYNWDPLTRELFVVFQVDDLAFIDGGSPGDRGPTQFDGGAADASGTSRLPHIIIDFEGGVIYQLTDPLAILFNKKFQDIEEFDGNGDGFPDIDNTGTTFEDQISLNGGNPESLYGIEEVIGGINTTLFETGDQIRDSSAISRTATIIDASALKEGVEHYAKIEIKMDVRSQDNYNGVNFIVGETVTGNNSGVKAIVFSWDAVNKILVVKNPIPYDTGDGFFNEFSYDSTVVDVIILERGNAYTTSPSIQFSSGVITATGTSTLTGDQLTSITVTNGGYGYTSSPSITIIGDGQNAIAQAVLGGEKLIGETSGASWRIRHIDYLTRVRNDKF
jgi:hypothetical protein